MRSRLQMDDKQGPKFLLLMMTEGFRMIILYFVMHFYVVPKLRFWVRLMLPYIMELEIWIVLITGTKISGNTERSYFLGLFWFCGKDLGH